MTRNTETRLGKNITLTPKAHLQYREDERGRQQMTFVADVKAKGGRIIERRVVAKGKAHDSLLNAVRLGERITVRGFYDQSANDDDPGGEIITAICLPRIDLRKRAA